MLQLSFLNHEQKLMLGLFQICWDISYLCTRKLHKVLFSGTKCIEAFSNNLVKIPMPFTWTIASFTHICLMIFLLLPDKWWTSIGVFGHWCQCEEPQRSHSSDVHIDATELSPYVVMNMLYLVHDFLHWISIWNIPFIHHYFIPLLCSQLLYCLTWHLQWPLITTVLMCCSLSSSVWWEIYTTLGIHLPSPEQALGLMDWLEWSRNSLPGHKQKGFDSLFVHHLAYLKEKRLFWSG